MLLVLWRVLYGETVGFHLVGEFMSCPHACVCSVFTLYVIQFYITMLHAYRTWILFSVNSLNIQYADTQNEVHVNKVNILCY